MTAGFKNLPVQAESQDGLNFDLLRPLVYQTQAGITYRGIIGDQTDGASTPQVIYSLGFTPFGTYWPAALLHDFAYRDKLEYLISGDWLNGVYMKVTLNKDQCDSLLLEAMQWLETDLVKAEAIYEAVHLGGFEAFNKDRA